MVMEVLRLLFVLCCFLPYLWQPCDPLHTTDAYVCLSLGISLRSHEPHWLSLPRWQPSRYDRWLSGRTPRTWIRWIWIACCLRDWGIANDAQRECPPWLADPLQPCHFLGEAVAYCVFWSALLLLFSECNVYFCFMSLRMMWPTNYNLIGTGSTHESQSWIPRHQCRDTDIIFFNFPCRGFQLDLKIRPTSFLLYNVFYVILRIRLRRTSPFIYYLLKSG